MSKPKMYGMNTRYIPNAKADMRHHKKVYQRGREKAISCTKAETCISCGVIIPEGRQVCPRCEKEGEEDGK